MISNSEDPIFQKRKTKTAKAFLRNSKMTSRAQVSQINIQVVSLVFLKRKRVQTDGLKSEMKALRLIRTSMQPAFSILFCSGTVKALMAQELIEQANRRRVLKRDQ